jgi:inward rectifier potassium channel
MEAESREPPPETGDLGFGSVVAKESRRRFLNRDGTFNVRREGLGFWESLSLYHFLLTLSWPRFLALVAGAYIATNGVFAEAYAACGPGALAGAAAGSVGHRLTECFFFSVQTLATIGYGHTYPVTMAAHLLVAAESVVGLLGFAVVTGIVFARFARPTAEILFSDRAIVAPYRSRAGFMFRIANRRSTQIVNLEAKVILSRWKGPERRDREFDLLPLERDRVVFLPLTWTIVHPIDPSSPLFGMRPEDLARCEAEFLIVLAGFDETFSQTVHARSSYRFDETVFGARFQSIFNPPEKDGTLSVNIRELSAYEPAELPAAVPELRG